MFAGHASRPRGDARRWAAASFAVGVALLCLLALFGFATTGSEGVEEDLQLESELIADQQVAETPGSGGWHGGSGALVPNDSTPRPPTLVEAPRAVPWPATGRRIVHPLATTLRYIRMLI